MKRTNPLTLVSLFCCGALMAAAASTTGSAASKPAPTSAPAEFTPAARVVQYGEHDVIPIHARLRFTTLIVLPKNEQIMDFVCGDKEFWIVNGAQNFAYVKPAKEGGHTDLNLVTASGNVYSFVLRESSDAALDLKVFVELRDESMISALGGSPKFVPAQQLDDFRQQADLARAQARKARDTAQTTIGDQVSRFRNDYPTKIKFAYKFDRDKKPFAVSAIFHDDKFTYIQANPEETPALYELKDGKPNLINFEFRNGTYVVDRILESGYLAIGKLRLPFTRQE